VNQKKLLKNIKMVSKCQFGTIAGVGGLITLTGAVFLGFWSSLFDFVLNQVSFFVYNMYINSYMKTMAE